MSAPYSFNRRVLIIDDNPAIHEDFRKILSCPGDDTSLEAREAALLGQPVTRSKAYFFEVDSASQGAEGIQRVRSAVREGRPYALAFVDIRMPPGMDGVETTASLWREDGDLLVVLCSAYADYSWEEIRQRLDFCQRLLVLRKPFDNIEVRQMAHALVEQWELLRHGQQQRETLARVIEAQARELEAANARLQQERKEQARLRALLTQAQKLEVMGRFAAGLAHEVNSPLGYVRSNLNYLFSELEGLASGNPPDDLEGLQEACRDALFGVERIRRIVQEVKLFAHSEAPSRTLVDVRGVLERSISMAGDTLGAHIHLIRDFHEVPPIQASEHGLGQVFLNLLINAAQALQSTHPEPWVRVATRSQDGGVVVEIQDNGCGIAPENLGRIFEPFFTTKPAGVGTGLGLPICHGIVSALGGDITVQSAPGQGTTFRILLPQAPPGAVA